MGLLFSSHNKSKAAPIAPAATTRAKFFATYQPQDFSLPNSIMFFIAKNPTSSKLYQNMTKTCKYFFVKNPILVVRCLLYHDGGWRVNYNRKAFDLNNLASKFWITGGFHFKPKIFAVKTFHNQNIVSSFFPKLYRCDAKNLSIYDQVLSFQDLSLLISTAEQISLENVTVKDKNGTMVSMENIIKIALSAKWMEINRPVITSETIKTLVKLPQFWKLFALYLHHIPEIFDLQTFYSFMKKNRSLEFELFFDDSVSEVYKNFLEEIVDEIIATEIFDYKPPFIYFSGLDTEKWRKLSHIYCSH